MTVTFVSNELGDFSEVFLESSRTLTFLECCRIRLLKHELSQLPQQLAGGVHDS